MPTVEVDGLGLHVEVSGSGPPLVLLHGFTGSAGTWRELTSALASEYTTIAPDIVGHARSDAPNEVDRYCMARATGDLVALLRALGHERAAWLGYSLGGRTALQLTVRHPEAVAALILEGTSPGISDDAERTARVRDDGALAERIEQDGVPAFVDRWEQIPLFASQLALPAEARAEVRATRLGHTATGLANSLRGMGAGAGDPLHGRLAEVSVPVLLLAGSLDTKYVAAVREMARTLPNATMQEIDGAGHAAHLERPAAFRVALLDFLRPAYPGARAAASTDANSDGRQR